MEQPSELSVAEIRKYMLANGCRVTNHALVKHFKCFLTNPQTQTEARKQFKTYVNILSTIKNENNQKYLILRKKYINECPIDDVVQKAAAAATNETGLNSAADCSIISESSLVSPYRQPPPYKPPPEVFSSPSSSNNSIVTSKLESETTPPQAKLTAPAKDSSTGGILEQYNVCVNEFTNVMRRLDPARLEKQKSVEEIKGEVESEVAVTPTENSKRKNSLDESDNNRSNNNSNKENIPTDDAAAGDKDIAAKDHYLSDNPISVKEATRKFNRMASEEEAKIMSPQSKKKPEKLIEEKDLPEVTLAHPKAKEWIVSMAKSNYHELAKLANDHPELVKLQDPATGYTALHWAAKHGNEDVVKLIAGTYKADVNAQTNGGYTPLHLAIQFGRDNIFELLWNVYKANRDLMDWSGNKPLDYSQQRPSVSASTCSKIEAMRLQRLNNGNGGVRRNQSTKKAYTRKRFGIPADWLFECASKEDNGSVQQFLGSWQWQWERYGANSTSGHAPAPAVSPTPSAVSASSSSSSSSSCWYDAESSNYESESTIHDDDTIRHDTEQSECSC